MEIARTNKDTHHRILAQIVVCTASNCVQVHQIFKVADLTLHPFLRNKNPM